MDKDLRTALRSVVIACRQVLEEDVRRQLEGTYGVTPRGEFIDREDVEPYVVDSREWRRERDEILAAIAHIESYGIDRTHAVEQFVRESAFTILNRLAALKLMEHPSRGLIPESVGRGKDSKGFVLFQKVSPEVCRAARNGPVLDSGFRLYLESIFDDLADELGVLFDRRLPQSIIFPSDACLKRVIELLNHADVATVWGEDETIGWVYQYFIPKELRDEARKASQAPRNSYELAFRNQFFTPRYVVEFLVDNTLGRIWYEMRRGQTRLVDTCKYLIRGAADVFLDPGVVPSDANQVPHRPKKDPRDLGILDPACGSGHFLLYAYDVLEAIYLEAWADPETPPCEVTGRRLRDDYPERESLTRAIPELIVHHNLHGIDIDLRATQIAALALWLRAQRSYQQQGFKVAGRPWITRSKVVCAEPMPGERELLEEFIATIQPKLLGQLVRVVFNKMALAGEAGSLLPIEEEIRAAVAEAKRQWQAGPQPEQLMLFPVAQRRSEQLALFDVRGITDESFWHEAEGRVVEALRAYASKAANGHSYRRRLFADDAAQGFAFIDLARKRFDVILMNPPFGSPSVGAKDYLAKAYPDCKEDIDAQFVKRGVDRLTDDGMLGVIANRTEFFKPKLRSWRSATLLERAHFVVAADLGFGVLDALVETATYVLDKRAIGRSEATFFRLLKVEDKGQALARMIHGARSGASALTDIFRLDPSVFRELPETRISYWASESVRRAFRELPQLAGNAGEPEFGVSTKDDPRFLRLIWEVPASHVVCDRDSARNWSAKGVAWAPFAKGGEYAPYFGDIHLVVDWTGDAAHIAKYVTARYPYLNGNADWIVHPESRYFEPGITYTRRTTSGFSPRFLPRGCVFGEKGLSVFAQPEAAQGALLALLMTRVVANFIELMVESADAVTSGSAARSYEKNIIGSIPIPVLTPESTEFLNERARAIWQRKRAEDATVETSRYFIAPAILQSTGGTLGELAESALRQKEDRDLEILKLSWEIEAKARQLYKLDDLAIREIDEEFGQHPHTFSNTALAEDEFTNSYVAKVEDVIDEEVEESGGARSVTKKMFFADRQLELLSGAYRARPSAVVETRRRLGLLPEGHLRRQVADLVSYCVGVAFGRWDVRRALSRIPAVTEIGPTDPVPVCSLGMLLGPDGQPANAVEAGYPLEPDWDGILVDDDGHPDDVVTRVSRVLEIVFDTRVDAMVAEISAALGVASLREYFRSPKGFFDDHVKRYSKSRRKGPIYWLLQSARKSYGLWLYYPRIDRNTVLNALGKYVDPKIRGEATTLKELKEQLEERRETLTRRDRTKLEKGIDRQDALLGELGAFKESLERVSALGYEPDLDDGVLINMAPFYELTPCKEAASCWEALLEGEYPWSTMAARLRERGAVAAAGDDVSHG